MPSVDFQLKAVFWFQRQPEHHPLTCGNDSTHPELQAQLLSHQQSILICSKCGYTQTKIPDIVYEMYRAYLCKGWLHNHKNELISDLKNMISDLEDDHYGAEAFFDYVERRVKKWRDLKKFDHEEIY